MSTSVHPMPLIIHVAADLLQRVPALRHASQALARHYATNHFVSDAELQQIGQQLWQVLTLTETFAQEFDQARQQAGAHILPILIESPVAAVQQLPWETLYHPTYGFLGKTNGFTLARRVRTAPPVTIAPETGPLRVLIFTTLPDDLDAEKGRLDIEEEQAQLLEALTPWILQGIVVLEMPDDGRFSTLQHDLRTFQPHLLFFSGHGKFIQPPYGDTAPYATLLFESETGSSESIDETQLAQALLGSSVQCVVLSACESGMTASDALTTGVAWRLSELGIPHVIGMRESVLDRAGTLFARHFCDAVARREQIDVALQQGRQAITTPLQASPWLAQDGSGLAEQSLGQWCLPMLITQEAARPLIDWRFTPVPLVQELTNQSLQTISLPLRFLGRRAELRQLQGRLRQGQLRQLLITGPGGQGKTALAGKLAQTLQQRGYQVLAWSARPGHAWEDFQFELELQLTKANTERYDRMLPRCTDEGDKARLLLRLLLQQSNNRLLLFFDNLETLQDPATRTLTNATVVAWLGAAQTFTAQGLILLLTSRWQLPDWPDGDHLPLVHASYGDFLQMARPQLPLAFFQARDRVRRLYATLHGNGRGLTFFAAAIQNMAIAEEAAFLARLAQATIETQTDMALAQIMQHLAPTAQALLHRLPAYQTPVPVEGIIKLGLDLADPAAVLRELLAVSLVEQAYAADLQTHEYQISPLVETWLAQQEVPLPTQTLYQTAARYQLYLFQQERHTLPQAIAAHSALHRAGESDAAHRLALDSIVGSLNRQGLYQTLLTQWLPPICQSSNLQIRGEALNQTGKQYLHIGSFTPALTYLQHSLKIRQEIGDKAGEGTTLNNISQIFKARGDYDTALTYLQHSLKIQKEIGDVAGLCATLFNMGHIHRQNQETQAAIAAWVAAYRLAKRMNLAQVLTALIGLAEGLGLPGGLAAWEEFSQRMGEEPSEFPPLSGEG